MPDFRMSQGLAVEIDTVSPERPDPTAPKCVAATSDGGCPAVAVRGDMCDYHTQRNEKR